MVGCDKDPETPAPAPNDAGPKESTSVDGGGATPTLTLKSTSTPRPSPTPPATPTPKSSPMPAMDSETNLDTIVVDGERSLLDHIPDDEGSCLLFSLEEDRLNTLFSLGSGETSGELEVIASCLSGDTVARYHLGLIERNMVAPFELTDATSACIVDRLRTEDKSAILWALLVQGADRSDARSDRSSEGKPAAASKQLLWSTFSCLNKNEWIASSSTISLNVGDVEIEALRCLMQGVGPEGFYDLLLTANESDTPALSLFTAARDCGVDLVALLGPTTPPPTPTAARPSQHRR